jgi:hypothetical protein
MTERHKNVHFSGPYKFHKSTQCCTAQPAIILLNLIKDGLRKLAPIITLLTCIQDACGFNLNERDYSGDFGGFPPSFHATSATTQTTSQLLPSTFFPIYYWLIILPSMLYNLSYCQHN